MEKLRLRITRTDVHHAKQFKIADPILFILQRATGTFWRIQENGLAQEMMGEFRVAQLPDEPLALWREYSYTGRMKPCVFDLELYKTQPQAERDEEVSQPFSQYESPNTKRNPRRNTPLEGQNDAHSYFIPPSHKSGLQKPAGRDLHNITRLAGD